MAVGAPVGAPVGVVGQFSPSGDLNALVGDTGVPVFMASFQKMTAAASPVFRCILDSDLTAFRDLL